MSFGTCILIGVFILIIVKFIIRYLTVLIATSGRKHSDHCKDMGYLDHLLFCRYRLFN